MSLHSFAGAARTVPRNTSVQEALRSRASIRAYIGKSVSIETVRDILAAARWSPSGSNLQPWKVIAITGSVRDEVCHLARRTLELNPAGEAGDYPACPPELRPPFRQRRSLAARQRYAAWGVQREDRAGRAAVLVRNFDFWGAPVGLFFAVPRSFGHSQWAHLGMFIQSVVLVAEEMGLGTCVQEAWGNVRETLRRHFGLPRDEVIYCGVALGYADRAQPINSVRTAREPVAGFTTFLGFVE